MGLTSLTSYGTTLDCFSTIFSSRLFKKMYLKNYKISGKEKYEKRNIRKNLIYRCCQVFLFVCFLVVFVCLF